MVTREQPEDYFGDGVGAERHDREDVLPAVGSDLVKLGFSLSGDVVGEDVLDGVCLFWGGSAGAGFGGREGGGWL